MFLFMYLLQDMALNELWALPRDSHWTRLVNRCVLTSRPRGVVHPHRLSRLVWRHCADYNKLSGVMRAKW
jgi:small subunit ribosomal protein S14